MPCFKSLLLKRIDSPSCKVSRDSPGGRLKSKSLLVDEDEARGVGFSQRTLKSELLACLYHRDKNLRSEYEFTSHPPTVIGSGMSGDVVLCRSRRKSAVSQNVETGVRCVKSFDLRQMDPGKLEKLKNEALIFLSLEHPHIARLFDVFENEDEVSLVMQYCSGGTLENAMRRRGRFQEFEFKNLAVSMLLAVNYIHRVGIVHRDIKPRNWVYEADGATVKLIDFGFSVKEYLGQDTGLQGCMGTLGYLAPEVVKARLSPDVTLSSLCDIWSLGVVFWELLAGESAFDKDAGQNDGYTEEVVLRDIRDVTSERVDKLLKDAPAASRELLRRMMTPDPSERSSAQELLADDYLKTAREQIQQPPGALPMATVLQRFRAHGRSSKPSRAWLLAVARSPTHLPWAEFCALRETFKMFDVRGGGHGVVDFEAFRAVVLAAQKLEGEDEKEEVEDANWSSHDGSPTVSSTLVSQKRTSKNPDGKLPSALDHKELDRIWRAVCGKQESLSYCEFLAVLLPPAEDVFEDVAPEPNNESANAGFVRSTSEEAPTYGLDRVWNPAQPVSNFLMMLQAHIGPGKVLMYNEQVPVLDVVRAMSQGHKRWVIVEYRSGRRAFFDYLDVSHHFLRVSGSAHPCLTPKVLERICSTPVGVLANCSGHSAFTPASVDASLSDVLKLISGQNRRRNQALPRRVPILDKEGKVVHVFSCLDFLQIALRFTGCISVLKSRAARVFDRRNAMMDLSVQLDDAVLNALRIMNAENLTVCPATSRELSGDMGGVVAVNVVSVSDLKWVMSSGQFDVVCKSVREFISWRTGMINTQLGEIMRQERLNRFKVVSVHAGDSLHCLAQRLLASKLQRVFLSSDDIARIVGVVGSRDILLEVIDQLL